MTGSERSADELADFVVRAARLRQEIGAFEQDLHQVEAGSKIFYCVDTNIVALFLSPSSLGSRKNDGYARVFANDADETTSAIAFALSRFIFYQLNDLVHPRHAIPMLLLIGHDAETRYLYERRVRGFGDEDRVIEAQTEHLQTVFESIPRGSIEEAVQYFRDHAPAIYSLFLENGSAAQLTRLNDLLAKDRVSRISVAARSILACFEPEHRDRVARALAGPASLRRQFKESRLKVQWRDRLTKVAQSRSASRIDPDAAALARLELINEELEGLAQFVLITGDASMIKAAQEYVVDPSHSSFSDLYLRHPRAFISSDKILNPGAATPAGNPPVVLSGWLETILAAFSKDAAPTPAQLKRITSGQRGEHLRGQAQRVLQLDPRALSALRKDWSLHTQAITHGHLVSTEETQAELKRLLKIARLGDTATALDGIRSELALKTEQTWQTFFETMVRAGYDLVIAERDETDSVVAWNPPPLVFDSFVEARQLVEDVLSEGGLAAIGADALQQRLLSINQRDPSGYSRLLAYSVLLAYAGRWHVALVVANRAVAIAQRISAREGETGVVSGREAYYFVAVARRVTARNRSDLDGASDMLDKADAALRKDLARPNPTTASDLRFQIERLSLDVSRYCFSHFGLWSDADESIRGDPRDILDALLDLEVVLLNSEPNWLYNNLYNRLSVSIFLTFLLVEDSKLKISQEKVQRMIGLAERLRPRSREIDTPVVQSTLLARAISLFAAARFLPAAFPAKIEDRDAVARLRTECERLLGSKSLGTLPYDRDRFELLFKATEAALKARA